MNARALAKELGCSVQPIFRAFESMEELKKAVVAYVARDYQKFLMESISMEDQMIGLGFAYVSYAKKEKHFFQLLHMSDRLSLKSAGEFATVGINREIAQSMAQMTGLNLEKATLLYQGVFFTAHGIASMAATNHCDFSDEEVRSVLKSVFWGMVENLKRD